MAKFPPPSTTTTAATLPSPSQISGSTFSFLDRHFKTQRDLPAAASLASELTRDCSLLHRNLEDLIAKLSLAASEWISRSTDARSILMRSVESCCPSSPPDGNAMMGRRQKRILGVELPALANEVARIETIRLYAETTLKLEVLVGDLEDATFSVTNKTSRNNPFNLLKASRPTDQDIGQKQAKLMLAVKAMNRIEEILVDVANRRPHWTHLLMAVDARVEKALSILRPHVLSNHRILLSSLGWPPSLTTSSNEKGTRSAIPNPLVLMEGENKELYCESFLKLCALQHLQVRRTGRQNKLQGYNNACKVSNSIDTIKQSCFEHGLWSIDELVQPIASRMEHHFSQWSDEPKFIFALVYKITRDFLEGVDNILQPLIDKAALAGCSAKEAWVSAMVTVLSRYLERQAFPSLVANYVDRVENTVINSSWLHLIDLMISFDKKFQVLASSETQLIGSFAYLKGLSQSQLLLSVFDQHLDWLQIWAEIELNDAQQKLNLQLVDEESWSIDVSPDEEIETFLLSTREDYKAPPIAESVVKISWAMIERGQSLWSKLSKTQFIRSSATLFLNHFFIILLQRFQDMDLISAILEDDALLTVIGSINTARYCEYILHEWNEDIGFLEMAVNDKDPDNLFFNDEISFLVKLETDCLVEIVSALLLQFDALSSYYIHDIEQWEREQTEFDDQILEDENMNVSPSFIEALDMLRHRFQVLRLSLNSKDFVEIWRNVAEGLDHFIFSSILLSNVKFSQHGAYQFIMDVKALFLVFKPFCPRPEAFFPCISDSLKLLGMDRKDVKYTLKVLAVEGVISEERLRARGLFHVSVDQGLKILRNRKFEGQFNM